MTSRSRGAPSPSARLFRSIAVVEPGEVKAVILSMLYFFFFSAATQWSSQCVMPWVRCME